MDEEEQLDDSSHEWPIKVLWVEYEKIAMHFNDLVLQLRIQALAVVAGISTIVGLFSKTDQNSLFSWEVAQAIFFALSLFWVAIWLIDFAYYRKLLLGAVEAIIDLEKLNQSGTNYPKIELSTKIKKSVDSQGAFFRNAPDIFYLIVLITLLLGAYYSSTKIGSSIVLPVTTSASTHVVQY